MVTMKFCRGTVLQRRKSGIMRTTQGHTSIPPPRNMQKRALLFPLAVSKLNNLKINPKGNIHCAKIWKIICKFLWWTKNLKNNLKCLYLRLASSHKGELLESDWVMGTYSWVAARRWGLMGRGGQWGHGMEAFISFPCSSLCHCFQSSMWWAALYH